MLRASRGDAVVLLATFLLVVFRDLTEGILVGFGLGALLFLHRMAQAVEVEHARPVVEADKADAATGRPTEGPTTRRWRPTARWWCTASRARSSSARRRRSRRCWTASAVHPRAYVIDVSAVPVLDSTAAMTIEGFVRKAHRAGAVVYIAGAPPPIRRALLFHGVRPPRVRFRTGLAEAVAAARARAAGNGHGNGHGDDPSEMAAA